MSAPTLAEMAQWPKPNYVNPKTLVPEVKIVMIFFTVLMVPFVIARVHMRLRSKGKLGMDDFIIMFSAVMSIASTALAIVATKYGSGYHLWDVKPEWVPLYRKIGEAGVSMFVVAVCSPKISVCFTYLLLFPSKRNIIFCWLMIVFLSSWCLSTVLVFIFQCRPIASYWDASIKSEYCVNAALYNIITGAVNSASDFLVYLWPVQFLWIIQIPTKQKLGVIFLFAVGVGACIAGVVRIYYVHVLFSGYDLLYYGTIIWIVSSVETNIGIIFTCMHAMRPVLSRLVPGFFSSAGASSKKFSADSKGTIGGTPKGFHARIKSLAAKSGWISSPDESKASKATTNSFADHSGHAHSNADSSEMISTYQKDYISAGPGKANALVTTGSIPAHGPADSIMYAQEVKVFSESTV